MRVTYQSKAPLWNCWRQYLGNIHTERPTQEISIYKMYYYKDIEKYLRIVFFFKLVVVRNGLWFVCLIIHLCCNSLCKRISRKCCLCWGLAEASGSSLMSGAVAQRCWKSFSLREPLCCKHTRFGPQKLFPSFQAGESEFSEHISELFSIFQSLMRTLIELWNVQCCPVTFSSSSDGCSCPLSPLVSITAFGLVCPVFSFSDSIYGLPLFL